jgi:hypothetical protein
MTLTVSIREARFPGHDKYASYPHPVYSMCLVLKASGHRTTDYFTLAICSTAANIRLITINISTICFNHLQEGFVWSSCTSTTKLRKSLPAFPTSLVRNRLTASVMLRLCPYPQARSSSNMLMYSLEKGNSRASWAVTSELAVKVPDLSTHSEDLILSPIVFICSTRVPA